MTKSATCDSKRPPIGRAARLVAAFVFALAFVSSIGCVRNGTAEAGAATMRCVENLGGRVGETDDGEYEVTVPKAERTGLLILRLPGVLYPDDTRQEPRVTAQSGGHDLAVGAGTAAAGCGSDSRTRYDVPIPLDQADGPVRVRVSGYRLPMRAVDKLPVEFSLKRGDTETPIGSCRAPLVAGDAAVILVNAPSFGKTHENITGRGHVVDRYGNPTTGFRDLWLEINGERPDQTPTHPAADGSVMFAWIPTRAGVVRVGLVGRVDGVERELGRSNPVVVTDRGPSERVYWGDPHSHTGFSDGFTTATPVEALTYARDVAGLDFASVTDHLEAIWGCPLSNENWEALWAATEQFNAPGTFVAIGGYEWTASFPFGGEKSETEGHAHLLFPGRPVRCGANQPECSTFDKLLAFMAPHRPVVIRHHTCAAWAPAKFYDAPYDLTPVVEVVSSHGSCETPDGPGRMPDSTDNPDNFTRAWIAGGRPYGLVAGSDNHLARPGARRFDGRVPLILDTGGLTAVTAPELTREAVLDAMRKRRTWATSGARILLEFSAGRTPMGGALPAFAPVKGRAVVHGTNLLSEVTIFRGDAATGAFTALLKEAPGTDDWSGAWTDPAPPAKAVYYLRAEQVDGELALSSPITRGE